MEHTPRVPYTPELAPASFAQQRLWFLSQLPGANEAYNEPIAFTLRGPLDHTLLGRARDALVARRQVLRTRLLAVDGEVLQRIDPPDTGFTRAFAEANALANARAVAAAYATADADAFARTFPAARTRAYARSVAIGARHTSAYERLAEGFLTCLKRDPAQGRGEGQERLRETNSRSR